MYGTPQLARNGPGTYCLGAALSPRRRRLRHFSALGALTAQQATEQIFPAAKERSGAGHDAQTYNEILASANAGQILAFGGYVAYVPGGTDCAGVNLAKPALTGTVGSLALKFVPQAFAAGPVVGGIVLAIGSIATIFSAIFSHHAAAVAKERSILCAAVPAANQSLQLIDQAIQSGQATPDQAPAALDNMLSGFQQAVQPIIKGADPTSSGECNAACRMLSCLRAIVLLKKSQYQDLAAQQAANPVGTSLAPITGAVQSVEAAASSAGLPTWVVPAAGFFLLWKLL
jgi:hypothetical protein